MADKTSIELQDGELHVVLNLERLDAGAAAAVKEKLAFDLPPGLKRAVVDLDGLKFIDSSGIGVLLSIYRKLPQEGSRVALRHVHPAVQSVIELLRLHRIFDIE